MKYKPASICVAMTGASGAQYALRLLQCLVEAGESIYLLVSQPAQIVIDMETDLKLPARPQEMQVFLTDYFNAGPDQIQVFHQAGFHRSEVHLFERHAPGRHDSLVRSE